MIDYPAGYFQEETRLGFQIPALMKRAWAATIEVLKVVEGVCEKRGIPYTAVGGTLLGAIRHKGYIPWDDDLDLSLLREDYDRLISYLPQDLPEGFVISGMYAEDERLQQANRSGHLRVMADEAYWSFPDYLSRFHGYPYPRIGIDIIPLDYVSEDEELLSFQLSVGYAIQFLVNNFDLYAQEGQLEDQLAQIEKACQVRLDRNAELPVQLWRLYDNIWRLSDPDKCQKVMHAEMHITGQDSLSFPGWDKEWFRKMCTVPFETTTVSIITDYDDFLRCWLGDYWKPVRNAACHDYPFYKTQEEELQRMFDRAGITTSVEDFCRNWELANGRS